MLTDGGIRSGRQGSISPSHTLTSNALVTDRVLKRLPREFQRIARVHYVDGAMVGKKPYHYRRLGLMHHRFEQAWAIIHGN
jgi:hypothetical protein